jgi:alkylhydroperoxidase family enzyme
MSWTDAVRRARLSAPADHEESRDAPHQQVDEILEFESSDRFDARERAALEWAMAIAWDPTLAAGDLWERLHRHFTEPQLVELGHFIALTLGQQRFLKTLDIRHGEILADTDAGLAPDEAQRVRAAAR